MKLAISVLALLCLMAPGAAACQCVAAGASPQELEAYRGLTLLLSSLPVAAFLALWKWVRAQERAG